MNRHENRGRMDRRITIQRATTVADDYGTPIETWADVATVWASKSFPATGSGEVQFDAVHLATTNVVFTINYRRDLLHTDRLVEGENIYDITRIAESAGPGKPQKQTRKAYLAITAELRK